MQPGRVTSDNHHPRVLELSYINLTKYNPQHWNPITFNQKLKYNKKIRKALAEIKE